MGNWTYFGVKQPGLVNLTALFQLVSLGMSGAIILFPPYAFLLWTGSTYRISALLANKVRARTRSNKFTQQCVAHQDNVSILDTISLLKLQYLGKCDKEI
jgi:hypothetical protein